VNYQQAKQKVITRRVLGLIISVPTLISTVVSLLKLIYFRIDDGSLIGGVISRPLKAIVSWVYENTHQYIDWFWEYSPTPDLANILDPENGYFIAIYFLIFVGMAFFTLGNKLANRLRIINLRIEDQMIEESIEGSKARSREQIKREIEIPTNSIFSQFHQLYLAPIVAGLVIALLLKLMGV
jgi:hypothetical protein